MSVFVIVHFLNVLLYIVFCLGPNRLFFFHMFFFFWFVQQIVIMTTSSFFFLYYLQIATKINHHQKITGKNSIHGEPPRLQIAVLLFVLCPLLQFWCCRKFSRAHATLEVSFDTFFGQHPLGVIVVEWHCQALFVPGL